LVLEITQIVGMDLCCVFLVNVPSVTWGVRPWYLKPGTFQSLRSTRESIKLGQISYFYKFRIFSCFHLWQAHFLMTDDQFSCPDVDSATMLWVNTLKMSGLRRSPWRLPLVWHISFDTVILPFITSLHSLTVCR
jgi:hypothetical protein